MSPRAALMGGCGRRGRGGVAPRALAFLFPPPALNAPLPPAPVRFPPRPLRTCAPARPSPRPLRTMPRAPSTPACPPRAPRHPRTRPGRFFCFLSVCFQCAFAMVSLIGVVAVWCPDLISGDGLVSGFLFTFVTFFLLCRKMFVSLQPKITNVIWKNRFGKRC